MTTTAVTVPLGSRSYQVHIGEGLYPHLPDLLQQHCPAHRYAIITDSNVAKLYGEQVLKTLTSASDSKLFTFPAGEANKTRSTWSSLTDQLLEAAFARDSAIVALGGGVVGDVAGFVASTYLRGVPFVQLPTTLLAMLDSSVGGKTGVDVSHGKNLVGTFYQPRLVAIDVETLATLDEHDLVAGVAEAIKHGAIADEQYFEWVVRKCEAILGRDPAVMSHLIQRSVEIKAGIVGDDERETGRRAILNFGHTIGHAIEAASDFAVAHGEAVAMGMVIEGDIGVRAGLTQGDQSGRLERACGSFGLPTKPSSTLDVERTLHLMRSDKKKRSNTVRFALLERIGCPAQNELAEWTHNVAESVVRMALAAKS